MDISEKNKIILPILLIAVFVFSSFGWIFYFHNYQLNQIIETIQLLNRIDSDIKEFNRAIQSGILTLDHKYAIQSDEHSLRVFDNLNNLKKTHPEEADKIKHEYMGYYSKLISINSLFLEKRLDEGRRRLTELELSYSKINDEITKSITAHTGKYKSAVWNINIFMATTSVVFTVMVSLIIGLFMHYSKKRKQAEKAMIESEKMASLGVLSAGVAHEIRNPLAIISLGAERLGSSLSGNAGLREISDNIKQAVQRADRIVKGLLDYSQQSPFKFEYQDVFSVLEESLLLVEHQIKAQNIKVVRQFPQNLPKIKCDASQMKQVFINILLNAIDAMPDGGTITISLKQKENNFMELAFTDTGLGIPDNEKQKIFDPFFSTKKKNGRSGLGLSIARGIVEGHGGNIKVESEVGKGTSVTITCPSVKGEQ